MQRNSGDNKKTSSKGPNSGSAGGAPGQNEGKAAVVVQQPRLTQPKLDFQSSIMLDGKKDAVKELDSITVVFFRRGLFEMKYNVRTESGEAVMSTSQFQSFLARRDQKTREEKEGPAAKGVANKLRKRLLVEIPEDLISPKGMRDILSLTQPKAASRIMGYSQDEMKAKGLNDRSGVLSYWNKMPDSVHLEMEAFQERIDPKAAWIRNLVILVGEELEQRTKMEAKRVEKELGKNRTQAGGEGLSPPSKEPEEDSGEEPLSPPDKTKRQAPQKQGGKSIAGAIATVFKKTPAKAQKESESGDPAIAEEPAKGTV
jgi:hypothetical protein